MLFRSVLLIGLTAVFLSSCAPATPQPAIFPTYDPFLPLQLDSQGTSSTPGEASSTPSPTGTPTREPTPTRVPLSVSPVSNSSTSIFASIIHSPTPDTARALPTPRQTVVEYVIQPGDSLGAIAEAYGVSIQSIQQANNISDPNLLEVGAVIKIPAPNPVGASPSFKVIPDSELVYGPASVYFDIADFINGQNGYLEAYTQDVGGVTLGSAEILQIVSQNYSVNPRLLLALLEYQSGWVTNPAPFNTDYPMGLLDAGHQGLYRQLTWAANTLNRGYYLSRANAISTVVLNDGSVAPLDPTINSGTVALQYLFAQLDDRPTWEQDTSPTGLLLTYYVFFGNPFKYAIEPLVPASLAQPPMLLPFSKGESWYFTGGPHGGWDYGSAWAALDFAPPNNDGSCLTSPNWVTAVADGPVVRAANGALIQDLDNDGYEQTGWTVLYMHVAEYERARPGEYLFAGERVGHPSCEGGISNATHLHIARKYNGEWIAADGPLPFILSGWTSSGTGKEYDGFLSNGNRAIEALDAANDKNQIRR